MIRFKKIFFSNDNNPNHIKSLDGLRGLAALMVILSHISFVDLFFVKFLNFQGIGKSGVYLFFVLSAFLLDKQILIALKANKTSKKYWANYLFRRFMRIFPLFIISLSIHLFASKFLNVTTCIPDIPTYVNHLLLSDGQSIFWSIPVEFKYYLISPFLMIFFHRILKWNAMYVILTISSITVISLILTFNFELSKVSTIGFLAVFFIGTLISIYGNIFYQKKEYDNIIEAIGYLCVLGIIFSTPKLLELFIGQYIEFEVAKFRLPLAICWGGILLANLKETGMIKNFFEFSPLRFLGVISYSLYLFHTIILNIVHHSNIFDIPYAYRIYIFFMLTILVSSVSYLVIEKPLSKIKLYNINHGTRTNQPKLYKR